MSSLRLALKQSLQETGHLAPDGDKKKRKKGKRNSIDSITNKRGRRPGEPPREIRKRGRPRRDGDDDEGTNKDASGERQAISRHNDGNSSSENEFSYDDDEEDESHPDGDDEEEGGRDRDDEEDDDDEDVDEDDDDDEMRSDEDDHGGGRQKNDIERSKLSPDPSHAAATASTSSPPSKGITTDHSPNAIEHSHPSSSGETQNSKVVRAQMLDVNTSDEEQRKKRRLMKKKLKHSAAHKIQNQWKLKKRDSIVEGDTNVKDTPLSSRKGSPPVHLSQVNELDGAAAKETRSRPSSSNNASEYDEAKAALDDDGEPGVEPAMKKKKKKKMNGVVPAPTADVLEWARSMSDKKCRKNIATGLRVKVRFATKVKREGKMVKKKIWYGGRVAAVSRKGSKIRIKYDDGTSEISKFPDNDVVVDAVMNGEHSVPADRFTPPAQEDELQRRTNRSTEIEDADGENILHVEGPKSPMPDVSDETLRATKNSERSFSEAKDQSDAEIEPTKKSPSRPSSPMDFNTRTQSTSPPEDGEVPEEGEVVVRSETTEKEHQNGQIDIMGSKQSKPMTPVPLARAIEQDNAGDMKCQRGDQKSPEPSVGRIVHTLASPEEGELSPGITLHKQNVHDSSESAVTPLPQSASLDLVSTSDPAEQRKAMVKEQTAAAELHAKESLSPALVAQNEESKLSIEESFSAANAKPKLAIRITNITGATMQSSLRASLPIAKEVPLDDILVDSPIMEETSKRKRPANPDGDDEEAPSKRRIRVSIGKLEETLSKDLASMKSVGLSSEATDAHQTSSANTDGATAAAARDFVEVPKDTLETRDNDKAAAVTGEKKKKKKSDRAKTPRPKSPMPKHAASPAVMTSQLSVSEKGDSDSIVTRPISSEAVESSEQCALLDSTLALSAKASQSGSKVSELPGKKSSQPGKGADDAIGNAMNHAPLKSQSSLESLGSAAAAARTGRKAAQEAMEKLNTKEKDAQPPLESGKKKKKRKRKEDAEVDIGGESDGSNETEWVQCDSCGKWRILPDDVKVSSLPNKWYCHMNVYDPKRSACIAPEQSAKQALKERKKARKRAKRLERVEVEPVQEDLKKEEVIPATPVSSPKPTKVVKSAAKVKEIVESKKVTPAIAEEQSHPSDSGSDTQKDEKKKGKKGKGTEPHLATEILEEAKKPGRKRGRPARNQPSAAPISSQESRDEDNVEWVQCEKCEKWRKLPPDISADELPDTWYCSMNTWNPVSASCHAAEDKTDAQHHEVGTSEWQLRQTHAGKYSYRQMIFGTGARKHNRPMSERSRAAESLFMRQSDDDENPHPTVMYSKSSCFLPRTSNFNKANPLEDNALGIFDVLSGSNLWAELRQMDATPTKVESNTGGQSYPKFATYENLPDDIKHAMQELVVHTLSNHSLTGDDVIGECQRYPWETSTNGLAEIRGYCNTDVIINTLLALVRDGIVEMTYLNDPNVPISEWVPKYRRVRSRRALEAVEAIKASRCMKIAKPWKQREDKSADWISGKGAFY